MKRKIATGLVEKVKVDSSAYGEHTRNKRGTFKPAILNAVLQKNADNLKRINQYARLLKNELDKYRQDFMGGLLWQRLLSVIQKSVSKDYMPQLAGFKDFEIHAGYPSSRLLHLSAAEVILADGLLTIRLKAPLPPDFKRKFATGYLLSMIVFFVDFKHDAITSHILTAEPFPLTDKADGLSFKFPVPAGYTGFMACAKVQALDKDGVVKGTPNTGMRIIEARTLTE